MWASDCVRQNAQVSEMLFIAFLNGSDMWLSARSVYTTLHTKQQAAREAPAFEIFCPVHGIKEDWRALTKIPAAGLVPMHRPG